MPKAKRHYVPCWICGNEHTNPASSSTCDDCGPKYARENRERKQAIKEAEESEISQAQAYQNSPYLNN